MKILVVTPDGILRNPSLREALPDADIFKGYDGRILDLESHPRINQRFNEIVISRRLSSTQAGAVLSHNGAQIIGEDEWTCILEDDAVILDKSAFTTAIELVEKLYYKRPTIILLYSGYGGVYGKFRSISKNFTLAKVLSLPTGAVGYVINEACRKMIMLESAITGGPDWPTWSSEVNFFQIYPSVIFHASTFKSIYLEIANESDSVYWPIHRQSARLAFISIFLPKITKSYGGCRRYFKIVILSGIYRKLMR